MATKKVKETTEGIKQKTAVQEETTVIEITAEKPEKKKTRAKKATAEKVADTADTSSTAASALGADKKATAKTQSDSRPRVISIDERKTVETDEDKFNADLLDLAESQKSGKVLTDIIRGEETHGGHTVAVLYHGEIKVIIPVNKAVKPPQNFRDTTEEQALKYMVTKRLGAEIDYVVTHIDVDAGLALGDRLSAMEAKKKQYYFTTDRDGNNRVYSGAIAEARVVATVRGGIFVDIFGVESYIPIAELSYQRIFNAEEKFKVGDRVLVMIENIEKDGTDVKVSASVKKAGENPYERALKKYSVGSSYIGKVTMIDVNGVFVSLDGKVDCLCKFPRERPPRGSQVTVKIMGIENNRIWGVITHTAGII